MQKELRQSFSLAGIPDDNSRCDSFFIDAKIEEPFTGLIFVNEMNQSKNICIDE
jgi:hypothetical protein